MMELLGTRKSVRTAHGLPSADHAFGSDSSEDDGDRAVRVMKQGLAH
jgi:hypothetical protein